MKVNAAPIQDPMVEGDDARPLRRVWSRWFTNLVLALTRVHYGIGSPEGVEAAPVGHLYLRDDGGAGTVLYVKEAAADASDPFGWVPK